MPTTNGRVTVLSEWAERRLVHYRHSQAVALSLGARVRNDSGEVLSVDVMNLTVIYAAAGRILALSRTAFLEDDAPHVAPRGILTAVEGQHVTLDADWRGWTLAQVHERCVLAHEVEGPRLRLRAGPAGAR